MNPTMLVVFRRTSGVKSFLHERVTSRRTTAYQEAVLRYRTDNGSLTLTEYTCAWCSLWSLTGGTPATATLYD